jgi:hypothetical protein
MYMPSRTLTLSQRKKENPITITYLFYTFSNRSKEKNMKGCSENEELNEK